MSKSERIGENRLQVDENLLEWFPKDCKPIEKIKIETTTAMYAFMQRGNKQETKH